MLWSNVPPWIGAVAWIASASQPGSAHGSPVRINVMAYAHNGSCASNRNQETRVGGPIDIYLDSRLKSRVTINVKDMAFSDLCKMLSDMTGISLAANPRVSDDKITLFCSARPLSEIMLEIEHLFDFVWQCNGTAPLLKYELT